MIQTIVKKMWAAALYFGREWIDWKIIAIGIWIFVVLFGLFGIYVTVINPEEWS